MVTQADPHQSPLLGKPQKPLVLRVVGTEREGQIVRLQRAKCVLGSAASCALRLVAAGVRPRHCVIWRGAAGMVLQRIEAEVMINGQSVTESPLVSGDVITLGAVSLRVETESLDASSQSERQVQSLEKRLGEIRGRNRRRIHRLVEVVRKSMAHAAPSQETLSDESPVEDSASAEKIAESERLLHEMQQLRESDQTTIEQLNRQIERLEIECRELAESVNEFSPEAKEAQEKAERDALAANERLQVLSRGWSVREEELTQRIEELEEMTRQMRAEPEPIARDIEAEVEDQTEETPTAPPSGQDSAQVSVADVLAKFGYDPNANDDEEEEPDAFEPPVAATPEVTDVSPAAPATSDDDDVSIEEYMSSLLNRMRGHDSQPVPASPAEADASASPEPAKPAEEPKIFEPSEFVPSRKAPEQSSDLHALRDLANQSARSAIDVHTLKSWSNLCATKLIVAGVALTTSICLLIETNSFVSFSFLGAAIGLIIAIFWGLQAAIVFNQVRRAKKPSQVSEMKILTESDAMFDLPEAESPTDELSESQDQQ
ncbi:MAG: FHA domain-containing protein [Blastopirellula sp. JB062]